MNICNSRSCTIGVQIKKSVAWLLIVGSLFYFSGGPLFAADIAADTLPTGYTPGTGNTSYVVSGNVATFYSYDGATTGTWGSFNIGSSATFNAYINGTHLSTVTGSDPSLIFGQMNIYSGQFFLVNPNGFQFGASSRVNTAGFVASTMKAMESDFLSGKYRFATDGPNASILNQGSMHADNGGYIALLSNAVRNEGEITAQGGTVAIGAGNSATLSIDNAGLVSIAVETPIESEVFDLDGNKMNDAIANPGTISADGGVVILSAKAADEVFDNAINHSGLISARTVSKKNGVVELLGGNQGITRVTGTIDASGKDPGDTGGTVHVLGDKVGLFSGASIDVSGDAAGGTALIGGDFQGKNPEIQNATATYVDQPATINADAITSGDGGKVIVWSNESTRVYGELNARGGALSGDGGFIETSGHFLDVADIRLAANAPHGKAGTWLLDPWNVIINASASSSGSFGGVDPSIWSATGSSSTILNSHIAIFLNNGTSVTINTTGNGLELGDITVNAPILKTFGSDATLTLNAENDIFINQSINSSVGKLNVVLTADSDLSGAGGVDINWAITTNGGDFTSTGVNFDNTGGGITTGTGNVTINSAGSIVGWDNGSFPDISGNVISLTAHAGGIGGIFPVTITASGRVNADTTGGGGDIHIESIGDLPIGLINAGSGTVFLATVNGGSAGPGAMTDADGPLTNIFAHKVIFNTPAGQDVASDLNRLEVAGDIIVDDTGVIDSGNKVWFVRVYPPPPPVSDTQQATDDTSKALQPIFGTAFGPPPPGPGPNGEPAFGSAGTEGEGPKDGKKDPNRGKDKQTSEEQDKKKDEEKDKKSSEDSKDSLAKKLDEKGIKDNTDSVAPPAPLTPQALKGCGV